MIVVEVRARRIVVGVLRDKNSKSSRRRRS